MQHQIDIEISIDQFDGVELTFEDSIVNSRRELTGRTHKFIFQTLCLDV